MIDTHSIARYFLPLINTNQFQFTHYYSITHDLVYP